MVGLTKIIKKWFVPGYRFKNLKQKPRNEGGLKKRAAQRRGKRLDRELTRLCSTNELFPKALQETKILLQELQDRNMQIISTQKHVWRGHVQTDIDMIVRNVLSNKLFVCEVKRGCQYKHCCTPNGQLKFQDGFVNDSPLHQHQMQALIGRWLLPNPTHYGVLLFYVDEKQVEVYEESDFTAKLTENGEKALSQICANPLIKKIL